MNRKSLFWSVVILNMIDVLLTIIYLNQGGREGNPLIILAIKYLGQPGILLAKLPFLLIFGLVIYLFWNKLAKDTQIGTLWAMRALICLYTALNIYSLAALAHLHDLI